jgi:hypothetical protein
MPLWGKTETDESKPKWLDNVNKVGLAEDCFATEQGWVLRHYKGADKNTARYWDEVLVAIGGLAGGTSTTSALGEADITAVFFEQEALAQGDTGTVVVIYNEQVDVDTTGGTPTINVLGTVTGPIAASYARGTGSNRLEFDFTVPSELTAQDLSISGTDIALNGGTIFDKGTSVASELAYTTILGAGGSGDDLVLTIA